MPETLRPKQRQNQLQPAEIGAQAQRTAFDNPRVEVKQSQIHGLGLFAARTIRKGTTVGYYEGPEAQEGDFGDHVLWIYDEDEEREYGIEGQNETRFVNHCKGANANFNGEQLIALRTIRAGEEITHDYGEAWA